MVIRASKNEIACPQQLYSSRIRELALTNRDFGTETHPFNMVFEDVNLGATLFDIGAGGAIQAVQIRFGDDIWIDPGRACPHPPEPEALRRRYRSRHNLRLRYGVFGVV